MKSNMVDKVLLFIVALFLIGFSILFLLKENKDILVKKDFKHTQEKVFQEIEKAKINPSTYKNKDYYTYGEIQNKIFQSKDGDIIELEKDLYLDSSLVINKSITIKSKNERVNIYAKNVAMVFSQQANNIKFSNINIYSINNNFLITSSLDGNKRKYSGVVFDRVKILLELGSSGIFNVDELIFKHSMIKGTKTFYEEEKEKVLFKLSGINHKVENSIFLDNTEAYNKIVSIESQDSEFNSNIVFGYTRDMQGVLSLSNSKNIKISNNIFKDLNNFSREFTFGGQMNDMNILIRSPKFFEGAYAIMIFDSKNIKDETPNKYLTDYLGFEPNFNKNYNKDDSLLDKAQLDDSLKLNVDVSLNEFNNNHCNIIEEKFKLDSHKFIDCL